MLARGRDNAVDYRANAHGRLAVGAPFSTSTLTSLLILHELDPAPAHEAAKGEFRLML